MHRAKPVAGMLDDYFIIIKRVRDRSHLTRWTWEIQRKSELLGVKYNGNEYVTAQDATNGTTPNYLNARKRGRPIWFLINCVACWEFFLFYPFPALDLLMFGAWFILWRRERQAILRGRAVTGATSIAPRQPPLDSALAGSRGANTRTRQAS